MHGNLRILPYDLITDRFFDNSYYLSALSSGNFEYSFAKMKKRDPKPVFPGDTGISSKKTENGETILIFTGAKDRIVTESYKLSLFRGAIPVKSESFSGKYMYLFEEDKYDVNLGSLKPGKYTAYIKAVNSYAKTSKELRYSFTV